MNLRSAILLAEAAGGQTGGSSLINYPGSPADRANEPSVRDKVRERLIKMNPDIDCEESYGDKQKGKGKKKENRHSIKETLGNKGVSG